MDIQEAWEIVSNIIDKTYTNQDYDDALEVIGQLVKEKRERGKPIEPRQDYSFEVGV